MMQGDELAQWLNSRCGKLTASRMRDAMDFTQKGIPTAKRTQLMRDLLAERLTGDSVRHYVNDAMQWGVEKECDAIAAYEAETGSLVTPAGFFDHPRIDNLGATPDGLLDDGLIEVKCPQTATFATWRMAGEVPDEHKPQMAVQCSCTGRKWCEFVAFDPRIRNPRHRLFIRRYEPTAEEIAKVEGAAQMFLAELDEMFRVFTEAAA